MRAKCDHRVPLSRRALEVLREVRELSNGAGLALCPVVMSTSDTRAHA